MSVTNTVMLNENRVLTIVADAFSYGSYYMVNDTAGGEPSSPIQILANSTTIVGPFTKLHKYNVVSDSGFLIATTSNPNASAVIA